MDTKLSSEPNKIPDLVSIYQMLTDAIKRLSEADQRIKIGLNRFVSEPEAPPEPKNENNVRAGAITELRLLCKDLESLASQFESSARKLESII